MFDIEDSKKDPTYMVIVILKKKSKTMKQR